MIASDDRSDMAPSYLNDAHIAAMFERLRRLGDRFAGCGSEAEDMDHCVAEMLATWTVCLWLCSGSQARAALAKHDYPTAAQDMAEFLDEWGWP